MMKEPVKRGVVFRNGKPFYYNEVSGMINDFSPTSVTMDLPAVQDVLLPPPPAKRPVVPQNQLGPLRRL